MTASESIALWREAAARRDAGRLVGCLAEDVELISPLTAQFRFSGRDQVIELMTCAYKVLDDIRFHTGIADDRAASLFLYARCGRELVEEAQLLRLQDGLIREITLFGRPLSGVTAVMAAIGPTMTRRQGRPGLARALRAATLPFAAVTRLADRGLVPLADPARARATVIAGRGTAARARGVEES